MKLSKLKFQDVSKNQELSKDDQKLILGGYSRDSKCIWYDNAGRYHCTSNENDAYENAGPYNSWSCNSQEANSKC